MEVRDEDKFLAVDIQAFRRATRDISFDLYLKLSNNNYAHVFSKSSGLDYKRLAQYVQKGVKELYVKSADEAAYREFISRPADLLVKSPEVSEEKRVAVLLNMTEQAMAELFTQCDVLEETAESTKKIINNYVELMAENPRTLSIMLKLVSHGEYLYYHSIATAIFSMYIAKASGQFNRRTIELVGLGGFLHDIGCTYLEENITDASENLTPSQWKDMRSHPQLGLRMIENTPSIPDEVRYIVYQHHEQPSGYGYPNGLKDSAIFYPAKIVSVADTFSALISRRPFREAFRIDQAVNIMQAEVGKFDRNLLQILASIFQKGSQVA